MNSSEQPNFREVLPKRGLVFQESSSQMVLCKPKLLPLKSFTLQKLEKMQKEASAKAKEEMEEILKKEEFDSKAVPTHAPETMSFE